jgi:hypothetical protein
VHLFRLTFFHVVSNVCAGVAGPPGFIPPRRCPVQSCERRKTDAGTQQSSRSVWAQFNLVLGGIVVRYQLKQIYCRPWTLSGLSLKLIESHYENNLAGRCGA